MNTWKKILFLMLLSGHAIAQDHLAVRINENGILKILRMAVKYNTRTKKDRTVEIPQDLYKFTLKKDQLLDNPIIPVVNEISNLNLNKNLDFYVYTSLSEITGVVDHKSVSAKILRSDAKGFDVRVSVSLPSINASIPTISLCEDRQRKTKKCGQGLKATVKNLSIATKGKPVVLTVDLRVRTDGKVISARALSAKSNLESRNAPTLSINFSSLIIPKIAIVINGHETELDTSRLKSEILARRSFLAKKLLGFMGDFIAADLADMLNGYLNNQTLVRTLDVFDRDEPFVFDEFDPRERQIAVQDATYQRPPLQHLPRFRDTRTYLSATPDMMDIIMGQVADVIRHAHVDLSLNSITTPLNKDLEITGNVNLELNNRIIEIKNTLGNDRSRSLPKLDLSSHRKHDVNIVVSEPLINGALDLVGTTGLYQELVDELANTPGFYVHGGKIHLSKNKALTAVIMAEVDLRKVGGDTLKDWLQNTAAAVIESVNSTPIVYFPIEIKLIPVIRSLSTGGITLDLKILSPFKNKQLINTYGYPTNIQKMTKIVREGVMEKVQKSLSPFVNQTQNVDLTRFLNQSGVVFQPKEITFDKEAYIIINADIVDINFNELQPKAK